MVTARIRCLLLAAAVLLTASDVAMADYPTRYIRLVVPWPAGGLVDIAARTIADKAKDDLGYSLIIENTTGAGGSIGAAAVARAEPDGYTLLFTTSALNMNASIRSKMPYDAERDFIPIVAVATAPLILATNSELSVKSATELVALAKAKPGEITYASPGIGSPAHFAGEMLRQRTGINIRHIAYKGAPEAMNDMIAARIGFQFANVAVGIPMIQSGQIVGLAITSDHRSKLLPNVPTMKEAGFDDFESNQWLGFLAPAKTPKAVIDRIAEVVTKALANDAVKAAFARSGMDIVTGSTPESFATLMRADFKNWSDVAKAANIEIK